VPWVCLECALSVPWVKQWVISSLSEPFALSIYLSIYKRHIRAIQDTYVLCKTHTCYTRHIRAKQDTYVLFKTHTYYFVHLSISLSIYISFHPSIYLSTYALAFGAGRLSIFLSIHPSMYICLAFGAGLRARRFEQDFDQFWARLWPLLALLAHPKLYTLNPTPWTLHPKP
jgi:hypothetical protein